jgi:uncharacterized protein YllA (UPF0747 family)
LGSGCDCTGREDSGRFRKTSPNSPNPKRAVARKKSMKEKLKDYLANVWYLMRVKPTESAGLIVMGFVIGLAV